MQKEEVLKRNYRIRGKEMRTEGKVSDVSCGLPDLSGLGKAMLDSFEQWALKWVPLNSAAVTAVSSSRS